MNATQATCGKDMNPAQCRNVARSCHRGCTRAPAGYYGGNVPDAGLHDVVAHGNLLEEAVVKTHMHVPIDDGDRGRHGAGISDGGLNRPGHPKILGARKTMADDGGLQRHDRRAVGKRTSHLWRNDGR
jgi:hypothetical protein